MKTSTTIKTIALFGMSALTTLVNAQTWQIMPQNYANFSSGHKRVFASHVGNTVVMGYRQNPDPAEINISMNSGDTWQNIYADKPLQSALIAPNGNLYLATVKEYLTSNLYIPDTLFRSNDGINWSNLGIYTGGMDNDKGDFCVTTNNTLLFPNEDGLNGLYLKKSTDNGSNWTNTGYMSGTSNAVRSAAASYSADTIIVGTYNSGVRYSHDGGTTFNTSTGGGWGAATVGNVVILPNGHVYAATAGGISKSTDGGITFSPITYNPWVGMTITQFLYHPPSGKFFTSAVQGIFESTDCITWANITGNLTEAHYVVDIAASQSYLFVTKSNEDNLYRYEITGSAGISEVNNESIAIYPNPASDLLSVNNVSPGTRMSIVDLVGKEVCHFNADNSLVSIPIINLADGIYTLLLLDLQGVMVERSFVVKR